MDLFDGNSDDERGDATKQQMAGGTSRKRRAVNDWEEPQTAQGELRSDKQHHRKRRQAAMLPNSLAAGATHLVVHKVRCSQSAPEHVAHPDEACFLDIPRLNAGDCVASPLHGEQPSRESLNKYIDEFPHISFIICREYDCEEYHSSIEDSFEECPMPYLVGEAADQIRPYYTTLRNHGSPAVPKVEVMEALSSPLRDAMRDLERYNAELLGGWDLPQHHHAPYVHFYHTREAIAAAIPNVLSGPAAEHMSSLLKYLQRSFGPDYEEADDLFARGLVTLKHLPKLFRSNDIIINIQANQPTAFLTTECRYTGDSVAVHCTTLSFDGAFKRTPHTFQVHWQGDPEEAMPIASLSAYPLRYGKPGLKETLLKRGALFWSCRRRKFVGYAAPRRTFEMQVANPRYMIDMQTYKQLHVEKEANPRSHEVELDEVDMNADVPPTEEFTLQLPHQIQGFGLHDKKWRLLMVEHIQKINWNKEAFDRLVLDVDKKGLITAMVKEHVLSDTSADIIEGKGNGLIILLHGSPGTGKTLTAESVAELAEKPLYRVTCGDIGTNPEDVEKYLDSVLYIGTMWKAVVLFDESDVFLEERSQADLQRNALVSVFLRVLEYYNGILILTSNRVGTFDEAFKSRVQLALHYPAIDEKGRWEIWHDFFQDLEKQGADANFEQLRAKTDVLARENLNGRQIRNAIRTARQLAAHCKEALSYDHLRKAIKVAQDFEQYVVETHGGSTHEEFAKAQNLRIR